MTIKILNNHLILDDASPAQIRALIPATKTATIRGIDYCAVPHTLEAARVLNNIGIKAPSPIRTQYNWRGRFTPRWYQVDTAEFFTLNMRCHCHSAMRCVDASTEFLTPTGWKRIDKYSDEDLVAQWNPMSKQAEFVRPDEYVVTPCDEWVHFKTRRGVDQMLTPRHRVVYYDDKGELKETTAEAIHTTNIYSRGWRGKFPVVFGAPDAPGIHLLDAQIRVMVMVIADGYFQGTGNRCTVRVKKDRKKIRARQLLEAAGIPFVETQKDYPSAVGYSIFKFDAPRREKVFSASWWSCSADQLLVVAREVQYWDGSTRRDKGSFAFSTSVKESADFVQYACTAVGRTSSLGAVRRFRRGKEKVEYSVFSRPNGAPLGIVGSTGAGEKVMNSSIVQALPGEVCYCFSVPSTYFIARRNGNIFVTGNTGKTNSALWAADYLKQIGKVNSVLVVAPLSTLWSVWEQAIFESFPLATFAVLHGSREKRRTLLAKKCDFYIINHHGVAMLEKELADRKDINLVIVDEVQTLHNSRAKTLWKPLNNVLNNQKIVRAAWGLTGTPTPNEPTDAFGQCKLITPENFKGHFTAFKRETMVQLNMYKWVARKGSENTVARVLKPSIRFERAVCSDMEPCYIERRAQLSEDQSKAYKQLIQKAATEVRGSVVTAVNAAALISKLVQVASGVAIAADGSLLRFDFGPRLAVLEELIEGNNEKVLVFVPFTGALDALATELRKRWTVAVVDGGVTAARRTQIFREFRELPNPHILVCHPQAMAHGLDLTAASLSVWYAPYWFPGIYQQANARTDGSKQKIKIDIAHIYATSEEKRIYTVLREKGRLQDVVLALARDTK